MTIHNGYEAGDAEDLDRRAENDALWEEITDAIRQEECRWMDLFEADKTVVTVRFTVRDSKAKGRIIEDRLGRTKIVFPARSWVGEPPKDGEEAVFRVVHDTKWHEPTRGVLFVERILPRITRQMWHGGRGITCPTCRTHVPILDERHRPLLHVQCTGCTTHYVVAI